MTRKEAIKELEILKQDYWDDDGYGHETKQLLQGCFRMAWYFQKDMAELQT